MKKCMVFAIMVCSLFFSASVDAKEPIHIGLSAPMTGQQTGVGNNFKRGIELGLDRISQTGGINGQSVKLIVRDSQGSAKMAKRIARKFAEDKRIVAVIGDYTSTCSMAAQPVYHRAGMVQLSPTSSHPSYAPGSPFSFGIPGTDQVLCSFLARAAVKRLQKKKLAVLYLNNDWGAAAQKIFADEARKLGAEVLAAESYLEETRDFIPVLEKLRSKGPEGLFLISLYTDGERIIRQRHQLGWNEVAVIGSPDLYFPKNLRVGDEEVKNLYTVTYFFPDRSRAEVRKFMEEYETRHNEIPDQNAALAFDAVNLLARAMKTGGTERRAIRDELARIKDFPGVTGKTSFTEHGDVIKEYPLLHVKNGEFVVYSE
ncbi:ABC transporter substrate-binding protein [Desulfobacterales bacterium HSG2]|nr:ABC transporter substrate-binding protein [Desulfobacterales bacterium HSG2]